MSSNYCKYCNKGIVATKRGKMCAKIRHFHANAILWKLLAFLMGPVYKNK